MQNYNPKLKNGEKTYQLKKLLIYLFMINLLAGCVISGKTADGIVYLATRGGSPSAQRIVWSPTDENKILVTAYETPNEPAEVYILDIATKQVDILLKQLPAYFFEAKWSLDGRHVLILVENNTKGFEPSGWWIVDIENKSSKFFLPSDDIALSPDGKIIAILHKEKSSIDTGSMLLQLMNSDTKAINTIATYKGIDTSAGLSWSSDEQNVVFSIGKMGINDLYVLNVKAVQVMQITNDGRNEYPSWSPKGDIIAYVSGGGASLYLISPDGKCNVAVPNLEKVWSPTWSPDGKQLAYLGVDGIYVMDINQVLGKDIYQNLCR